MVKGDLYNVVASDLPLKDAFIPKNIPLKLNSIIAFLFCNYPLFLINFCIHFCCNGGASNILVTNVAISETSSLYITSYMYMSTM